jgi:hypothetical protein
MKLTKAQINALIKFSRATYPSPRSCGVRRDVAWRLVDMTLLTGRGQWGITQAGRDAIAAHEKDASK